MYKVCEMNTCIHLVSETVLLLGHSSGEQCVCWTLRQPVHLFAVIQHSNYARKKTTIIQNLICMIDPSLILNWKNMNTWNNYAKKACQNVVTILLAVLINNTETRNANEHSTIARSRRSWTIKRLLRQRLDK